jgi:rsbT antagonist protein RsbS
MSTDPHFDSLAEVPRVPMQITAGCLLASIQVEMTTELLRRFQRDLLDRIKSSRASAVIVDVSGVEIMDLDDFNLLRRSMAMASIMGARPILVGLQPGIVASLIALDADVDNIEAAADLDDALRAVQSVGKHVVLAEDALRPSEGVRDR